MANYKKHIGCGCIAYCIALTISVVHKYFLQNSSFITLNKHTLLQHIPSYLEAIEYTIHYYFPLFIASVTFIMSCIWPFLLICFEWLLFTLAGAMFPDIDIKSTSQKYWYSIVFITLVALIGKKKLYAVAAISLTSIIPLLSNHRGIFHNTWFVIAFPLGAWYGFAQLYPSCSTLFFYDALFFIAGALSHLWLDKKLTFRFF
ncbi:MAG: metal-dependent hydrolase [Candidatus Babeliales bacterium]